jgi:hypothetical protein
MFWVAPEFASQGPGWEVTPDSISFGQIVAVPLFALGLFSWMAPSWVGENLKKVGMIFGVYINLALVAVQIFHITTGAANFDPMAMIPALVLAGLFFTKSRASD